MNGICFFRYSEHSYTALFIDNTLFLRGLQARIIQVFGIPEFPYIRPGFSLIAVAKCFFAGQCILVKFHKGGVTGIDQIALPVHISFLQDSVICLSRAEDTRRIAERYLLWQLFLSAVVYTTISLAIPYVLSGQYFMLEEKDNTIRLMNYDNVVSDAPAYPVADRRITLFDNSGVLKFSIHSDNLYFIESDDNYIQVWYTDSTGTMKKYMLRCRLKTVEDSFADSDLVRCHRKFIVNIRKVRLLSSSRDGYSLDLESDATPQIPVSKTYEQAVLARFNSRI